MNIYRYLTGQNTKTSETSESTSNLNGQAVESSSEGYYSRAKDYLASYLPSSNISTQNQYDSSSEEEFSSEEEPNRTSEVSEKKSNESAEHKKVENSRLEFLKKRNSEMKQLNKQLNEQLNHGKKEINDNLSSKNIRVRTT